MGEKRHGRYESWTAVSMTMAYVLNNIKRYKGRSRLEILRRAGKKNVYIYGGTNGITKTFIYSHIHIYP